MYVHEEFRQRFNAGEEAFQITNFIAEGGQAWVFQGVDKLSIDQKVALKVFPGFVSGNGNISIFEEEAAHLRQLNHFDNVVTVFGTGNFEDQGEANPYLIMELADGSLEDVLKSKRRDNEAAAGLLLGAMKGMAGAHDKGILHCDLKPSNLLIKNGKVKVADFGVAINRSEDTHTVTHDVKGTLPYMPIEQYDGKPRPASDVYAMGVIAYQLFTGKLPRKPDGPYPAPLQWFKAHDKLQVPVFDPRKTDKVAEAVQGVVRTALERNHKHRYPGMGEFHDAFSRAAARGIAEQKKQRVIIDIKEKKPPEPLKTRPYKEGADKAPAAEVDGTPESAPQSNPSRRTVLRAILGAGAVAGGLVAVGHYQEIGDWFKQNLGTPKDQIFAARVKLLESMTAKLTTDSAKSTIVSALASNHPQEATTLMSTIKDSNEAGYVWAALAPQYPTKTAEAIKNFAENGQLDAATNAAMGLALYINSDVPKPNHDQAVDVLNDLINNSISKQTGSRDIALILNAANQTAELTPSYGGTYTSKALGDRLLEYGKDPNFLDEFNKMVNAAAPSAVPALRKAVHGMLDYAKKLSEKDRLTIINNAAYAASRLAEYSSEEGLTVLQRIFDELPETMHAGVIEISPGIAVKDPSALQDVLDKHPTNGTALFAQGALAGYSPVHVSVMANKFKDGTVDRMWLHALADPTDDGYVQAALASMVNEYGKVPDGKIDMWTAGMVARMAMAATTYQKTQHYLSDGKK